MQNTVDIRHLKETGFELKKKIVEMVSATQTPLLLVPLPDTLMMTKAQFDHLNPDPEMQEAYKSFDRIYVTPLNAMNVVIAD